MRFTRQSLRSLIPALVVAALAALATSPASAQVRFNIPFSFLAAGKICPPGTYLVSENSWGTLVTLHGAGHSFTWLLGAGNPAPEESRVVLSFDHQGATYALRTVQYASQITPRLDKKLVKETIPAPPVVVLAK